MPGVDTRTVREPREDRARFDGGLVWKGPRGTIRYVLEEKPHVQNQDVRVVIDQPQRWSERLPPAERAAFALSTSSSVSLAPWSRNSSSMRRRGARRRTRT